MIDSNRNFVNNTDLNEVNSLTHLIEYLDPIDEGEVNPIHHSNYYNNEEFMEAHKQIDVKLSILNLNCQCVNSKFDKIKLFLEPDSVITLQETWADNETEMKFFNLPNYTMVYDDSRLSKHGGLVTYIHNTFTFERLSDDIYNQNSTVYESMFLKIPNKSSKFIKYIIGNIYRRPSSTIDELGQFINEFTRVTQNLQEQHIKSYLCGDYNINLLKIDPWRTVDNALNRKARRTTPDAISIDNHLCTSKPKIADEFNNYFATICANNIIPDIPTSHTHYLNNATESTFNFKVIDNATTMQYLSKITNSHSCGHDNISSSTLKCIAHEICECLTLIINQSITTGIFPENLKIAKVVPIYIRKMISLKLKTIGLYQFYL